MSKSVDSPQGTVLMLDPPEVIERKFKRAVTDTETEVRFDPDAKPGVSNLLAILAAAIGEDPVALADKYTQYGPLKTDTADAVIELLRPVRERYTELVARSGADAALLAQRCRQGPARRRPHPPTAPATRSASSPADANRRLSSGAAPPNPHPCPARSRSLGHTTTRRCAPQSSSAALRAAAILGIDACAGRRGGGARGPRRR